MRSIEEEQGQPIPINLRTLHTRIIGGDAEATGQFYQYVFGRTPKIFSGIPESEDLADTTAIKAASRFHLFEPPEEVDVFDRAVNSWIYTIAINVKRDFFRRTNGKSTVNLESVSEFADQSPAGTAENHRPLPLLQEVFDQKAKELLKPEYYTVVRLRMEGLSTPQIAQELGITEVNARQRLSRGRRILVRKIIEPAGFIQAIRFGLACAWATGKGRIDSVKFLGMYYITEEQGQHYIKTKADQQRQIEEQGLVPAGQVLTTNEMHVLSKPKSEAFRYKVGNVIHIKTEDIAAIKGMRIKAKPPKLHPPQPGLQRLAACTQSLKDYNFLLNAAKKHKFEAVLDGHWWWVNPKEAERFLSTKRRSDTSA